MNRQESFIYTECDDNISPIPSRYERAVDLNYRFHLGDLENGCDVGLDDSRWRLLNLPHDWSIEGEYDVNAPCGGQGGFLPTGIGWYRKRLKLSKEITENRRVYLSFDGVFCNSTVYVDGIRVGGREYGWLSFSCDITEQVRGKASVLIAVKVDNSVQPAARWYTGSGIYSHVRLFSVSELHIAENGVYIITPADKKCAPDGRITVKTMLLNSSNEEKSFVLRTSVLKKGSQTTIAQTETELHLKNGESLEAEQKMTVFSPCLWSADDPNLHTAVTEIIEKGQIIDGLCTDFGFRSVSYDENGLYINGKNIKLKGVSSHWALGAIGAAQPENIIRHKIAMLKNMGANAIRTSHNACPPDFYRLCDEMGMMVMDELFEGERGKVKGDYGTRWFKERWREDVEYWVKRDRNHPSIVLFSIGNETGSENDNTGIAAHIKKFDRTRPVTGSRIFTGVDIPGANGISEYRYFNKPPIEGLPVVCAEGPHTHSVRGVYRTKTSFRGIVSEGDNSDRYYLPHLTNKQIFLYDWSRDASGARSLPSSYDNCVSTTSARKHWTLTRDDCWRIGEFRWTAFDYIGEADYVVGGWPYRMFHTGLIDTALFEKDLYYLYQSMWAKEKMLHILPSWTHPTLKKGELIPVWVYSNCESAELFLNGRSLGRLTRGDVGTRSDLEMQYDWLVPYEEGEITAVGFDSSGNEIIRKNVVTASRPSRLILESLENELPTDPQFIAQVSVGITDDTGNIYPYGENRIYFSVEGAGYLKALDNGSPTDTEAHINGNRRAFMGHSRAFVSPTQDDGGITLTAASIIGEKRQLTSSLVSIDVQSISLRGEKQNREYDIFYTLDGSEPSRVSQKYTSAFNVVLGTTVRAAVYTNDDLIFTMEESFAENEGMYWELGNSREGAERKTEVFIDSSCIENFRLCSDSLKVVSVSTDTETDAAKWQVITDSEGYISFINTENGGALSSNGTNVFIAQNGISSDSKWLRFGEAEHYDYLIHARSGKALVVSDGKLILDDRRNHNDADMRYSRAFWHIKNAH